jgi:hypothetical protein
MQIAADKNNRIAERLIALGEILVEYQSLWQPRAFHHRQLPWEAEHPELAAYLRAMPYQQAVDLQTDDNALLELLSAYLPVANILRELIRLPLSSIKENTAKEKTVYPPALINEIPGRKLAQIEAFLANTHCENEAIIDWCSGKGHLARLAAYHYLRASSCTYSGIKRKPGSTNTCTNLQITGLEWNANLVAAGNNFAEQQKLPISVHHVDVMSDQVDSYLEHDSQILALHACGDLHIRLLEKTVEHRCKTLSLSPCCYHLIADEYYQPLSNLMRDRVSQGSAPRLTRDNLRTAVQQTVTAPGYARRQRETLQAWRLGFDLLQRQLSGVDEYLALPTLPSLLSKSSFADFCRHVAALKGIILPEAVDWSYWENGGWQRFEEVTKLDLARLAFRRAMEIWLVLDRAQYLQEQGYQVDVSQFCDQQLTPRNIFLAANITK